jgi:hypothetical protein
MPHNQISLTHIVAPSDRPGRYFFLLGLPAVVVSNDREVVSDANWLAWTTMLAFRRYRVWRCRLEVEASRLFC